MRTISQLRVAAALVSTLAFAACADQPVTPPSQHPLFQAVVAMGFAPQSIIDKGAYFVAEGDIIIRKSSLRAGAPRVPGQAVPSSHPLYQFRTPGIINRQAITQVRVNLSGLAQNPTWVQAFRDAMARWSAIPGSALTFVESTTSPHLTVSLYYTEIEDKCSVGAYACADFPSGGNPGAWLYVNGSLLILSYSTNLLVATHELGHTVGLRHTNMKVWTPCGAPENTDGATQIAGTPYTDSVSVMNGCPSSLAWNGFSFYDRVAYRTLYPARGPAAIGSIDNGHPRISWTAPAGATRYAVYSFYDTGMGTTSTVQQGTTTTTSLTLTHLNASAVVPCTGSPGEFQFYVAANYPGGPESPLGPTPACFALY
jgi:hypothetical protein